MCERELETEHNWNILTPLSYGRNVVSFLFSWCSTGGLGPTLLDAGFLYYILSASSLDPKLHRDSRGPPWSGVAFPTTSRLQLSGTQLATPLAPWASNSTGTGTQFNCPCHCQLPQLPSWLRYIIVQRLHDRPLDLWNRRFNRHQAEITVMQFTGHSLPVHQSMGVPWEFFLLVPFC